MTFLMSQQVPASHGAQHAVPEGSPRVGDTGRQGLGATEIPHIGEPGLDYTSSEISGTLTS